MRQISIEGLPGAAIKALMAAEGTTHERRRRSHLVKFVAVVTERGGDVNAPSLADVRRYSDRYILIFETGRGWDRERKHP